MASITNASSPDEAIIIATSAPKLISPWVYSDTDANPPIHPGIIPRNADTKTCVTRRSRRRLNRRPSDFMLNTSMSIIIMITRPVTRMAVRRESVRTEISIDLYQ
ncbi:MAG: hypothetical protein BWY95_01413 [Bacteroidetes bacterium ADurb.BinA104]|nr:MAG: hypothetical protein BWY95_01413 [Bacteroidetes bacterium ADurb.BinA104]